jgi:hypothetical protein
MPDETINLLLSGFMGILGGLSLIIPNMFVSRALKRDELSLQHKYNEIEKRNELLLQHNLALTAKKRELVLQHELSGNPTNKTSKELLSTITDLEIRMTKIENMINELQERHGNNE